MRNHPPEGVSGRAGIGDCSREMTATPEIVGETMVTETRTATRAARSAAIAIEMKAGAAEMATTLGAIADAEATSAAARMTEAVTSMMLPGAKSVMVSTETRKAAETTTVPAESKVGITAQARKRLEAATTEEITAEAVWLTLPEWPATLAAGSVEGTASAKMMAAATQKEQTAESMMTDSKTADAAARVTAVKMGSAATEVTETAAAAAMAKTATKAAVATAAVAVWMLVGAESMATVSAQAMEVAESLLAATTEMSQVEETSEGAGWTRGKDTTAAQAAVAISAVETALVAEALTPVTQSAAKVELTASMLGDVLGSANSGSAPVDGGANAVIVLGDVISCASTESVRGNVIGGVSTGYVLGNVIGGASTVSVQKGEIGGMSTGSVLGDVIGSARKMSVLENGIGGASTVSVPGNVIGSSSTGPATGSLGGYVLDGASTGSVLRVVIVGANTMTASELKEMIHRASTLSVLRKKIGGARKASVMGVSAPVGGVIGGASSVYALGNMISGATTVLMVETVITAAAQTPEGTALLAVTAELTATATAAMRSAAMRSAAMGSTAMGSAAMGSAAVDAATIAAEWAAEAATATVKAAITRTTVAAAVTTTTKAGMLVVGAEANSAAQTTARTIEELRKVAVTATTATATTMPSTECKITVATQGLVTAMLKSMPEMRMTAEKKVTAPAARTAAAHESHIAPGHPGLRSCPTMRDLDYSMPPRTRIQVAQPRPGLGLLWSIRAILVPLEIWIAPGCRCGVKLGPCWAGRDSHEAAQDSDNSGPPEFWIALHPCTDGDWNHSGPPEFWWGKRYFCNLSESCILSESKTNREIMQSVAADGLRVGLACIPSFGALLTIAPVISVLITFFQLVQLFFPFPSRFLLRFAPRAASACSWPRILVCCFVNSSYSDFSPKTAPPPSEVFIRGRKRIRTKSVKAASWCKNLLLFSFGFIISQSNRLILGNTTPEQIFVFFAMPVSQVPLLPRPVQTSRWFIVEQSSSRQPIFSAVKLARRDLTAVPSRASGPGSPARQGARNE